MELTAEQVWEMVKDVYNRDTLYSTTGGLMAVVGESTGRCCWFNLRTTRAEPHEALALIVDAAKREMGTAWYGCQWSPFQKTWKAYTKTQDDWPGYEADTEAAAVLAAYKAWREATNG